MSSRSFNSKDGSANRRREPDEDLHDTSQMIEILQDTLKCGDRSTLRKKVRQLLTKTYRQPHSIDEVYPSLQEDLAQILNSRTLERAKYYARRLIKSLTESKTNGLNDINLYRWKEYNDVLTDSLWTFDRRDTSGAHLGWYWGNFVPQIPHQVLLRYTRRGDWVLDPFAGSGTTLIEGIRLGRNVIGLDINEATVKRATKLIMREPNTLGAKVILEDGDSTIMDFNDLCRRNHIARVQLVIMHPPYFDIIKFSNDSKDLSNSTSVEKFLDEFGSVVRQVSSVLQDDRYLVLVAGDKYQNRELIPLGFYMMEVVMKNGFKLTGIIAKNFEDTRTKRDQKELWRYRALAGGFYVFKHEYVFVFKKSR
ncbi:MAG: DNA methyltransferase [Candidatus Thermoplasmatota archaeon]|nr:DNA methyltransferase [Candidatus Thermoplasmatota archaeon]MCL6002190.1 DNA methyltransferase [Candidatus Thermoplasmatota archaeon]